MNAHNLLNLILGIAGGALIFYLLRKYTAIHPVLAGILGVLAGILIYVLNFAAFFIK